MSALDSATLDRAPTGRPAGLRLIKAELLKIRTINVWWLFLLAVVAMTALAFLFNAVSTHFQLHPTSEQLNDPEGRALPHSHRVIGNAFRLRRMIQEELGATQETLPRLTSC